MPQQERIGVIGIIVENPRASAEQVNALLSQYAGIIVGRMGVPYRAKALSIISLIIDGTTDEIGALCGKLGNVPGVTAKSVLAPQSRA
nr:TM1266 family iron-only hydrogenase system putative regulator [Maliibacterium massiliense]